MPRYTTFILSAVLLAACIALLHSQQAPSKPTPAVSGTAASDMDLMPFKDVLGSKRMFW